MRKFVSEFLGTLVLVLFACGTAAVTGCSSAADTAYLLTALSFGLVIVAMAYAIGQVSGCHINPAVSLGMLLSGRMKGRDFVSYLVAQFAGALAGAAILAALIGTGRGLGTNGLFEGSAVKSLIVEVILTFVFVLTILFVTHDGKYQAQAGLVIGLTLTLVHILGIYFTGTSVNPARSFGPALMMALSGSGEALNVLWVFIAGPLAGGALAAGAFRWLSAPEAN